MQIHGSCAARDEAGVLILGPPGSGKSDLVLRLLDRGFVLVADDRVNVEDAVATAPEALAGLLEVRGIGIVRMPYRRACALSLIVDLAMPSRRLPEPERHQGLGLPLVRLDPALPSAAQRVELALDLVLGRMVEPVGAFAR